MLDVESAAVVEIISEDTAYSIESALLVRREGGWRAARRELRRSDSFDELQDLRRIWLVFDENRNQGARKSSFCDGLRMPFFPKIVRPQWNV